MGAADVLGRWQIRIFAYRAGAHPVGLGALAHGLGNVLNRRQLQADVLLLQSGSEHAATFCAVGLSGGFAGDTCLNGK